MKFFSKGYPLIVALSANQTKMLLVELSANLAPTYYNLCSQECRSRRLSRRVNGHFLAYAIFQTCLFIQVNFFKLLA